MRPLTACCARYHGRGRGDSRYGMAEAAPANAGGGAHRRCMTAENDPDAKPVCGTPRTERSAAAVVPLYFLSRHVDGRGTHHHEIERAPFRPWANGREAKKLCPLTSRPQDTQSTPIQTTRISPTQNQHRNIPDILPVAAGNPARPKRKRLKRRRNLAAPYAYGLCRR